jgi:hypothetical protein
MDICNKIPTPAACCSFPGGASEDGDTSAAVEFISGDVGFALPLSFLPLFTALKIVRFGPLLLPEGLDYSYLTEKSKESQKRERDTYTVYVDR